MNEPRFLPLSTYQELPPDVMQQRVDAFEALLQRRRTVRQFSDRPVPRSIIEKCLLAAGTAPSGAHQQPWHFVAISDPVIKARIRIAAEEEERKFYHGRAPKEWLDALRPLGTDEHKPYLETAPWLIAVFLQRYARLRINRQVRSCVALTANGSESFSSAAAASPRPASCRASFPARSPSWARQIA